MRVLHLVHSLAAGGMERVVVQVANGLARRGLPQAVCCLHHRGELADQLAPSVYRFDLGARPNDPSLALKLRRVCRSFRPDIVDMCDTAGWADGTMAAASCRGIRRVRTFHGFLSRPARRWRAAGHLLGKATHVLRAVSGSLADQAAEVYRLRRERFEVLPNGIDAGHFRCQNGHVGSRPFTCVTVASLTPAKNPLIIPDLLKHLHPETRYVWLGDGPLRPALETWLNIERLSDRIVLPGRQDDIRPWLADADVFVLPSTTEAAPLSVLEAMSMSLPVVATAVGDLPRFLESGGGVIVPKSNVIALADAVEQLRRDPARRRAMGDEGRNTVQREYTVQQMLRRYEDSYTRLLGESAAAPCAAPQMANGVPACRS